MAPLLLTIAALKARTLPAKNAEVALARLFDFASNNDAATFVTGHLRPLGARYVEIVSAGLDRSATPTPAAQRLQFLNWIVRHETWRLPALLWLSRTPLDAPETLLFLSRLEALAWVQTIRSEDATRRDRRYLALLAEIDDGSALASGGALTITPAERSATRDVLLAANFSRRAYKHFLLLRLDAVANGDTAASLSPPATVEHIFPQRPTAASSWVVDFAAEAEATRLRHLLGNLTLLTEREQNAAGNMDFAAKRPIYAESAFALSRELAALDAWTPAAIRQRTATLADRFLAALGIPAD